jgi:hypothetical protein
MNAKAFLQGYLSKTAFASAVDSMQPGVLGKAGGPSPTYGVGATNIPTVAGQSFTPQVGSNNATTGMPNTSVPQMGSAGMQPRLPKDNSTKTQELFKAPKLDNAIADTSAKTSVLSKAPSANGATAMNTSSLGQGQKITT